MTPLSIEKIKKRARSLSAKSKALSHEADRLRTLAFEKVEDWAHKGDPCPNCHTEKRPVNKGGHGMSLSIECPDCGYTDTTIY